MSVRKIIHIDCDCFYAAVEMRDNPDLRHVPLAIGGSASQRGVISTCNYIARRYGIHSAMPTKWAIKQCPGLVLLPHSFDRYREASQQVHRIFRDYSDKIEPLSLDEAYLDVSGTSHCQGSATLIAQTIRARIEAEVGITASAGIAANKLLAKIASDWNKPNGQMLISPDQVAAFMPSLPLGKLWGIGKVTAEKLARHGLHTCADAQAWSQRQLIEHFGNLGIALYQQCRGQDDRPVAAREERKTLSVEHTFAQDLPDLDACINKLPALYADFQQRLSRSPHQGSASKIFIKIKFFDFTQTTMERSCTQLALIRCSELLQQAWRRGEKPVRLLGLGVRFLDGDPHSPAQHNASLW